MGLCAWSVGLGLLQVGWSGKAFLRKWQNNSRIWLRMLPTALVLLFGCSVVSGSLQPHGLQPTRLLCPWNFPGKNMRGLLFPFPGHLPDSGMDPESPALAAGVLKTEPPGKPSVALEEESNILDFVLRTQPLFVLLGCSLFLHNLTSPIKFVLFLCNSGKAQNEGKLVSQSVQSLSCVRLCNPMNCSMPGLLVHHQLPEFTQTHVH